MADDKGILIASNIIPAMSDGAIQDHATHIAKYGKGGWREVATIADRDAITDARCEVGMSVYVTSEKKLYILSSLDTSTTPYTKTWSLFSAGGVVEMPTPSETESGNIVQYIGETTEDYTQGYFYKCISDGAEPATYSWEQIDVQPATDLIWGNIEGDITNQTDLNTELTSLQDQIDSLSGRGRYLTLWNCSTGLAETNPPESPYTYKTGDYFIVGTVAAPGETNYRPDGTSYTTGVASTAVETEEVSVDDTYIFDGTTWHLQYNSQKTVTFTNIEGSPYDNTNLADALNSKVSKVEDASVVYGTDENGDETTYDLSEFHKGGWHEVSTVLDRDAIPDDLLEVGMIVYVTSEAKGYILTSLNTEVTPTLKTWEEYKPGQGDYIRKITTYPISSVSPLFDGEIIQYQGPTVPPYWNGYFYKDEQKYSYISSKSSNMGPASINIIDESLLRNYVYRNQSIIPGGWSDIKLVFSGTYAATVYATNGETEVQLNGFNSQEEFEHVGLHVSSSAGYPVSGTIAYVAPAHVWTQVDVQPNTAVWGSITGTLSEQTDLQEALDAKQDTLTPGNNITIEEDSQTGDLVISSTAQESFFRGRFEDWVNVPTDSSLYQANFRGETTPCNSDYMVVDNASGYVNPDFSKDPDNIAIRKSLQGQPYGIDITIGETTTHYYYTDFPTWTPLTESGWISIIYIAGSPGMYRVRTNVTYYVDNERHNENTETTVMVTNQSFETVHYISKTPGVAPIPLRGGWNFGYFGTWDEDGKNGWKPQYQVEDVLPIASPIEQGIAKLYNTTGQNTDGSMTQKSITDALNEKQNELTAGTNITIEEDAQTGNLVISSVAQESFFRGRFENWSNVPTDPTYYEQDLHNPPSKIPEANDYIVVNDMSDWRPADFDDSFELWNDSKNYTTVWAYKYNNVVTKDSVAYSDYPTNSQLRPEMKINFGPHDEITIIRNGGTVTVAANTTLRYNETIYTQGETVFSEPLEGDGCSTTHPHVIEFSNSTERKEGTWRMRYQGIWDTDGKSGWKPEYQIENVLPIANSTEPGITKLYTDLGENTDGAVDQATVTTELGKKQNALTAGTGIDISTDTSTGKLVISSTSYESLFKGKYNTWNDVPTVGANYPLYIDDGVHTHEPTYTDYMVVVDASTVPGGQVPIIITFRINAYGQQGSVKTNIDGTEYNGYGSFDGKVQVRTDVSTGNYGTQFVVLGEDIEYQGTTYHQGQVFLEILHNQVVYGQEYTYNAQLSLGYPYEGTWRFSYRGVWATDNRNGWKGEYPIEQELPIASDTVAGITKLYTTTGSNTDGTMDQNSITTELNAKQDVLTAGNNITIDANNRIDAADKTLVSFVIWEDEE